MAVVKISENITDDQDADILYYKGVPILVSFFSIVTKTAGYTATLNDYTIICDTTSNSVTITFPDATTCAGKIYNIKRKTSGGNQVIADGDGTQTIDGELTVILSLQWSTLTVQSDGTNWIII